MIQSIKMCHSVLLIGYCCLIRAKCRPDACDTVGVLCIMWVAGDGGNGGLYRG